MFLLDSPAAAPSALQSLEGLLAAVDTTALVLFADRATSDGPVVAAVDESPAARSAARLAAQLADGLDAELLMAHAPRSLPAATSSSAIRRRRRGLERVAAGARRATGSGEVELLDGDAPYRQRLLGFARERGARVLVVPSGEVGDWLAAGVTAGAPFPVVAVADHDSHERRR